MEKTTDPTDNEPVTKSLLCKKYRFGRTKLHRLMNVDYLEELQAVGYKIYDKELKAPVVQKFIELHGEPTYGRDIK